MIDEIDGRPLREQIEEILNDAAARLATLGVRNRGVATVAHTLAVELDGEEDQGWVYVSNVLEPVEFLADLAEQVAEEPPTEKRSLC